MTAPDSRSVKSRLMEKAKVVKLSARSPDRTPAGSDPMRATCWVETSGEARPKESWT